MRAIKKLILKRRIKRTVFLLNKIDATMRAMSMPKWKRKQIWRDFIKSESQRMNVIDILNEVKL